MKLLEIVLPSFRAGRLDLKKQGISLSERAMNLLLIQGLFL